MTFELLLALLLALSPYIENGNSLLDRPVSEVTSQDIVTEARHSCRTILESPAITLMDVPLGQFVDDMIGSVKPEDVAGIFAEDFKPKFTKLGLDYDKAIDFYLALCHREPLQSRLVSETGILQSLKLLHDTRDEILEFLSKLPLGSRPGSKSNPYRTLFRLADGKQVYDSQDLINNPWVTLDKIPKALQQALIATEDKQFYQHKGIDITSLVRAVSKSMEGQFQGGSTITQQLIKNLYYYSQDPKAGPETNPRLRRKLGELIIARELERAWGKDAILEAYFNNINFGRGTKGVAAASQLLFGKALDQLDLGQIATLAAIPKRPGVLTRRDHFEELKERQAYVLKQMQQEGFIKSADIELHQLRSYPFIEFKSSGLEVLPYLNFIQAAQRDPWYLQYRKDYAIDATLTLHPGLQAIAEDALVQGLLNYERRFRGRSSADGIPEVQGAVVIMDHQKGDVLALQGGSPRVRFRGQVLPNQFDRASREYRQPGSTIKPLVYLMALENGLSPNTLVPDQPLELPLLEENGKPWSIKNYGNSGGFGEHSLRFGLERSRNLMTAWLLELTPVTGGFYASSAGKALDEVRRLGQAFGAYCTDEEVAEDRCPSPMTAPRRHYPFILGAQETSLLRMVTAYSRIANGGKPVEPKFIKDFRLMAAGDQERLSMGSNPLNQNLAELPLAADPRSIFQLKTLLMGVTQRGTAARLARFGDRVAGKTGTSNKYKDAWFIGFTSSLTIGVWVGYVDQRSLGGGATGGQVALPIFESIISKLIDNRDQIQVAHFPSYSDHHSLYSDRPEGLVAKAVNLASGCIQEEPSGNSIVEYFKEGRSALNDNFNCYSSYAGNNDFYSYFGDGDIAGAESMGDAYEIPVTSRPSTNNSWRSKESGHFGSSSWIMGY
jgi:penicillin-binding protein 1A